MAVGLLIAPAAAVGTISDTVNIRLPGGNNGPAPLALRFSQATFPEGTEVEEVLLATEETFADALASGALQGDSPLLLTPSDVLRADVAREIDRMGARRVTILGGTAALDESVEESLTEVGLEVTRLAGDTRFETAVAIADVVTGSDTSTDDSGDTTADTAIVARGFAAGGDDTQAFADALAAGAWAAANRWPIYLTQSETLTPSTREAIAASGVDNVMLLGGEAAIAPQVQTDLEALGIEVDRVSGATRFHTAVAIAGARGYDSVDDAQRIILVEGQADDAWAAGFAAAAHGAQAPAPILLANGDSLPPATLEFLLSATGAADGAYAIDAGNVTDPVLICAAGPVACDQARAVLGLPQEAALTLEEPEDGVPSRSLLEGTLDLFDYPASIAVFGPCITDGLVVPDEDGAFQIAVADQPGVCSLDFEITFANGSVQLITRPILVAPAMPQTGLIVDTETGGDRYRFVPDGGEEVITIAYSDEDLFIVDGQDATIGAFEASVTVADGITFSADTADGSIHELTNVDPETITTGTVGNVDLGQGTLAIIEPVSGVVLRGDMQLTDDVDYAIGLSGTNRAGFEAEINEGDVITFRPGSVHLTNRTVTGLAGDLAVDAVSGIARFRIDALGDDPHNAEDDRFRAVAEDPAKQYRVDNVVADFATFAAELSVGDHMTHRRTGGVETFELDNAAPPPVQGLVTETFNPDGSPVAPEPSDGGDLTVLTPTGRRDITYTADAVFSIDQRLATEVEFEAARTPGDDVTHQVGDPSTDTAEEVSLVNRDLAGDLADITEGADTFDVVVLAGVVFDDLDYTQGVLGGDPLYVINGDSVGLAQFENELALVDRGEVRGTIVVRATAEGTEHRLTSEHVTG
ncbi:MAG TPA: cell wall-binding repeat-containing protein [Euzebya sp.]|nr:cell wall-binding repeat-containing protein [Euzebya sp.]